MEDSTFYNVYDPRGSKIGTVELSQADMMTEDDLNTWLYRFTGLSYTLEEIEARNEDTLTVSDIIAGHWFTDAQRGDE